jgi:hypothetical protein
MNQRKLLDELVFVMSFGFTNPGETPEQMEFDRAVHARVLEIQNELLEAGMPTPAPVPEGLR